MESAEKNKLAGDFLIAEFNALRNEILKRMEIQHQLVSIAIVASGAFLSIGDRAALTVVLLYPVLALFLSAAWIQNDIRIRQIGMYIREELEVVLKEAGVLKWTSGWEQYLRNLIVEGRFGTLSQFMSRGVLVGSQVLAITSFVAQAKNFSALDFGLIGADACFIVFTLWLLKRRKSKLWTTD